MNFFKFIFSVFFSLALLVACTFTGGVYEPKVIDHKVQSIQNRMDAKDYESLYAEFSDDFKKETDLPPIFRSRLN